MLFIMILILTFADNLSLYAIEQEKEIPNEFVSKYEVNSPELKNIDAYFNGTLIFFNSNNQVVLQ